jgi:multiple sugar transport system substrate-binding protein
MAHRIAATCALICWGSLAPAAETLTLWYHGAGNAVERGLIATVITDFNASQNDYVVTLQALPQATYVDSVMAGAQAGTLPDIMDVEAQVLPNWVWSGILQPLQIDPATLAGFLPGAKGVYNGRLYGVGLWDFALSLATRQSTLDDLHLRTPTLERPWTADEFDAALKAAKASGRFKFALDLGMAWQGEWYSYAFLPFLYSFGGDLEDRATYAKADGVLNGVAGLAWGKWWQHLFQEGYAQAKQEAVDRDNGFASGSYAFVWDGNWAAEDQAKAFADTVFLAPPDLGHGAKVSAGSWQLAVSARSAHPQGAARFIAFAVQDRYLAAFANGIGLMPATLSAAALVGDYGPGGRFSPILSYARALAVPRPITPGYVTQSRVFEKLALDIANGAEVRPALDAAAAEIDADITRNAGYAPH